MLDADGINALAGHMDEWERRRGRVTVLTPHEGEFLRVGGDLSQGRTAAAEDFARRSGAVVVLKGPGTVVAGPDGRCRVNTTGNCGMAKGGSGDVLSGVVLALLGLGMDAFDACCCAVWLHGRAGDLAAQEKGQWGMTPTDLLERLPQALREVTEKRDGGKRRAFRKGGDVETRNVSGGGAVPAAVRLREEGCG